MATIEARRAADGSITYRVKVRVKGIHETQTFTRKTDAKIWASKRESEIRDGRVAGAGRKTLAQAIERYRREELPKLARTEQRIRLARLAWWEAQRGGTLLRDISRPQVQEDLRALRSEGPAGRPVAFATANRYKAALGAVLSCALEDWHWLVQHPLRGGGRRKRPKGEREVERQRELQPEEKACLWQACRASREPRLYALVVCAYQSGAREGELMALEWTRVQLHPLVLDLETGSRRPGVPRAEVVDTKTGEPRILYFPGEAGDVLREMAKTPRLSRYLFAGPNDPRDQLPVFPRNWWRSALAQAKLDDFHFHDLRHSWACNLLDAGATLPQLMILGGWKSPIMVRRYAQRAQREGSAPVELWDRIGRR